MKQLFLFGLLAAALLFGTGCKKEDEPVCEGCENPTEQQILPPGADTETAQGQAGNFPSHAEATTRQSLNELGIQGLKTGAEQPNSLETLEFRGVCESFGTLNWAVPNPSTRQRAYVQVVVGFYDESQPGNIRLETATLSLAETETGRFVLAYARNGVIKTQHLVCKPFTNPDGSITGTGDLVWILVHDGTTRTGYGTLNWLDLEGFEAISDDRIVTISYFVGAPTSGWHDVRPDGALETIKMYHDRVAELEAPTTMTGYNFLVNGDSIVPPNSGTLGLPNPTPVFVPGAGVYGRSLSFQTHNPFSGDDTDWELFTQIQPARDTLGNLIYDANNQPTLDGGMYEVDIYLAFGVNGLPDATNSLARQDFVETFYLGTVYSYQPVPSGAIVFGHNHDPYINEPFGYTYIP